MPRAKAVAKKKAEEKKGAALGIKKAPKTKKPAAKKAAKKPAAKKVFLTFISYTVPNAMDGFIVNNEM
jgi:hypothetical protein